MEQATESGKDRQGVTVMNTKDMSVLASLLRDARRDRFESPPDGG
jgi:hypothetical protein